MKVEKRKPRSYKIADSNYNKALKRGKGKLATFIEYFVSLYGEGVNTVHIQEDYLFGSGKSKSPNNKK